MNPLDMQGPDFLKFYLQAYIFVMLAAIALRRALRQPGGEATIRPQDLHPYEIAYLGGGADRATDAAVVALYHEKTISVDGDKLKISAMSLPEHVHPVEKAILASIGSESKSIDDVHKGARGVSEELSNRLSANGLIVDETSAMMSRLIPFLLQGMFILLGATKICVGLSRNRNVFYLVVIVVLQCVVAFFFLARPLRSRRGDRFYGEAKFAHSALETTAKTNVDDLSRMDMALATGLFGLAACSATDMAILKNVIKPPPKYDGSSGWVSSCGGGCSGGSSGCGGGCGGGGCGGCGS